MNITSPEVIRVEETQNERGYPILDATPLAPGEARGQQWEGLPGKYSEEERFLQRYAPGLY